jgi:hypothetical protein
MTEETRWKNFARQTASLDLKCNYRHCSISMPVVDTIFTAPEKWSHWRQLDGGGGQVRPGIMSRTHGHDLTSGGSQGGIGYLALPIPPKTAKNLSFVEGRKY